MRSEPSPPVSALAGALTVGRLGRADGPVGCRTRLVAGQALTSLSPFRGKADEVAARIERIWGLAPPPGPPSGPSRATAGGKAVHWAGPDRWLALCPRETGEAQALAAALDGLAAVVDVSNAVVLIEVAGPRARDVLAKGVTLDLHPRAFAPGHAAITTVAHVTVHLWQMTEEPMYGLAIPRSYAAGFWDWLAHAAAEHGLEVLPPA